MEPGLPGTENANILTSGGGRLLPNKLPGLVAEQKLLTDQEKNREIEVTHEMEKEIKKGLGPGPQNEILSSGFKLQTTRGDSQTLKNGHQFLHKSSVSEKSKPRLHSSSCL